MRAITSRVVGMELAEVARAHGAQSWEKTSIRNWQGPGKGVNVPLAYCTKDVLLPLALGLTNAKGDVTTVLLFERLEGVRSGGYCKLGANDYRQVGPREDGDAMDLDTPPPPPPPVRIMEWNGARAKLVLQGAGRDTIERWLSEYAVMLADVAVGAPAVNTLKRWAGFDLVGDHAAHEAAILLYAGYVLQRDDVAHWLSLEKTLFCLLNPTTSATEGVIASLLDWLEVFADRPNDTPASPLVPIPCGWLAPVAWMRALDELIVGGERMGLDPPEGMEALVKLVRDLRPLAAREGRIALSLRAMARPSWDDVGYVPPAPRYTAGAFIKPESIAPDSKMDIEDLCSARYAPPCMRNAVAGSRAGQHLKNPDRWPLAEWFAGIGFTGAEGFATVRAYVASGSEFEGRLHAAMQRGKGMVMSCKKMRERDPPGTVSRCPYADNSECARDAGLSVDSFWNPAMFVAAKNGSGAGPHS
jgi:hypothetical protein